MKILVENSSRLIKHKGYNYTLSDSQATVDDTNIIFVDLNSSNSTVYEVDSVPSPFHGNKYLYVDEEIVDNPDYVEPEE